MAIEITDIEEAKSAPPTLETKEEEKEEKAEEPAETPPAARRGRPPGAKEDKAPRKRPRAASPEVEAPPPPRPVTRLSSAPKRAPRRVQIVEEDSDDSPEEATPSPRTRRHQEWAAYRQHQADTHQANVNRYASLFDRMLA